MRTGGTLYSHRWLILLIIPKRKAPSLISKIVVDRNVSCDSQMSTVNSY